MKKEVIENYIKTDTTLSSMVTLVAEKYLPNVSIFIKNNQSKRKFFDNRQ